MSAPAVDFTNGLMGVTLLAGPPTSLCNWPTPASATG